MTLYYGAIWPYVPTMLHGLALSLYISFGAMATSCLLAIALYSGKRSEHKILRAPSVAYIQAFRNTPLLVQLYLIYFGLGQLGINFSPIWAGFIGLTLNNSAYIAEIYRGGFDAVDPGIQEAGHALGMTSRQVFRHLVLLPGLQKVYPALCNQLVQTFLASSIAAVIAMPDLMTQILNITTETQRAVEALSVGGLVYLVTGFLIGLITRAAESSIFRWRVNRYA